jgi:hypothetical protein
MYRLLMTAKWDQKMSWISKKTQKLFHKICHKVIITNFLSLDSLARHRQSFRRLATRVALARHRQSFRRLATRVALGFSLWATLAAIRSFVTSDPLKALCATRVGFLIWATLAAITQVIRTSEPSYIRQEQTRQTEFRITPFDWHDVDCDSW